MIAVAEEYRAQAAERDDSPAVKTIHEPGAWTGPFIPAKPIEDLEESAREVAGKMRLRVSSGCELTRPMVETITEGLNPGRSLYVRRQIAGRAWELLNPEEAPPSAPAPEPTAKPTRRRAQVVTTDPAKAAELDGRTIRQRPARRPRWERPAEPERTSPAAPSTRTPRKSRSRSASAKGGASQGGVKLTSPSPVSLSISGAPTAAEYRARLRLELTQCQEGAAADFRRKLEDWSGCPIRPALFRRSIWTPVRVEMGLTPNAGYPTTKRPASPRRPAAPATDPAPWDGLRTSRSADTAQRGRWHAWMLEALRRSPGLSWEDARLAHAREFGVWIAHRERFVRTYFNPACVALGLSPARNVADEAAPVPIASEKFSQAIHGEAAGGYAGSTDVEKCTLVHISEREAREIKPVLPAVTEAVRERVEAGRGIRCEPLPGNPSRWTFSVDLETDQATALRLLAAVASILHPEG